MKLIEKQDKFEKRKFLNYKRIHLDYEGKTLSDLLTFSFFIFELRSLFVLVKLNPTKIDVSAISKGIYLIAVYSGNDKSVKKIIIE